MGRLRKILVVSGMSFSLIISFFLLWLSYQYTVPIMMYHNVEPIDQKEANWVHPERFAWHMDYLKRHHYNVISLDKLVEAIRNDHPLPRNSVVITFDDGYQNNYIYALPILQQYRFPATIFIPSDKLDKEGYLTWDQLKKMMEKGFSVGSHTRTHLYLPDKPVELQKDEIRGSKDILEEKLQIDIDYLAYPIGGFSETTIQLVQQAGYKGAFTTNRGYNRFDNDVYALKRIRFSDKDNRLDYLWIKLSGYYNVFRESKRPH